MLFYRQSFYEFFEKAVFGIECNVGLLKMFHLFCFLAEMLAFICYPIFSKEFIKDPRQEKGHQNKMKVGGTLTLLVTQHSSLAKKP